MNLKVRGLSNQLVNTLNSSDVPIEVKRLIVKDILTQLNSESEKMIRYEIDAKNDGKEEEDVDQL